MTDCNMQNMLFCRYPGCLSLQHHTLLHCGHRGPYPAEMMDGLPLEAPEMGETAATETTNGSNNETVSGEDNLLEDSGIEAGEDQANGAAPTTEEEPPMNNKGQTPTQEAASKPGGTSEGILAEHLARAIHETVDTIGELETRGTANVPTEALRRVKQALLERQAQEAGTTTSAEPSGITPNEEGGHSATHRPSGLYAN